MVMSFGRMSEPLTKVQKVDSTTTAKSYNFAYKYEDSNHPTARIQIGHDHYTYDANGNPTLVTNDSTNTTREMYWDEDNRLMVLSDNGKTSRYTYNAAANVLWRVTVRWRECISMVHRRESRSTRRITSRSIQPQ